METVSCQACKGKGYIQRYDPASGTFFTDEEVCSACGGRGYRQRAMTPIQGVENPQKDAGAADGLITTVEGVHAQQVERLRRRNGEKLRNL